MPNYRRCTLGDDARSEDSPLRNFSLPTRIMFSASRDNGVTRYDPSKLLRVESGSQDAWLKKNTANAANAAPLPTPMATPPVRLMVLRNSIFSDRCSSQPSMLSKKYVRKKIITKAVPLRINGEIFQNGVA